MYDLKTLVPVEHIRLGLKAASKRQLLKQLAEFAAGATNADKEVLLASLIEREKLGTTGLGDGIAIPHAKIAGLDHLAAFFVRLETPIDFDSLDGDPVDLVFLLIAPDEAGADHLKALARIARVLRDDELCEKLRKGTTAQSVHEVLGDGQRS